MLLDLAEHGKDSCVSLKDISERQNISKKYLEQIILIFSKSDILRTYRGFQGGYRLKGSPSDYTVGQILRLTEGNIAPVSCLECDPASCERSADCLTLPVWRELYRIMEEYLDKITLQDILDGRVSRDEICKDRCSKD